MILTWIIFVPALGAALCLVLPGRWSRRVAMLTTALTLVLGASLFTDYFGDDAGGPAAQTVFGSSYGSADSLRHSFRTPWISGDKFTIEYYVGMDGLSFPLVILTCLISFLSCWASFTIKKAQRAYYVLFLLLETGMLGVFLALDFFLFYVFWEVMLLPMYFLIGVWGGPRKEYAAIKFFLFTLAGSVLMLVAIVACYFFSAAAPGSTGGTFDIIRMSTDSAIVKYFNQPNNLLLGFRFASVMFLFLGIGFAIKVPTFPFHTWLPDAHVEAPTPISMILAGVLLKMGAYGFFRIAYPMFPAVALDWAFYVALIGVISILYGALCAMAQTDFKKLVAYSSISHMGYVMLGLAVLNKTGFQGAMFQVLAHGISSPMCFFLVGVIYERAHHREINRFGGLWLTMPTYGSLATLGFFASLGLPALCGFIGEAFVVLGAFRAGDQFSWAFSMAILAAFGAILTAGYILWMIQRVYLGPAKQEYQQYPQASRTELAVLAPMAVLCIVMGILPKHTVFDFMNGTLDLLVEAVAGAGGMTQPLAAAVGL